jgi:hypothetical protein
MVVKFSTFPVRGIFVSSRTGIGRGVTEEIADSEAPEDIPPEGEAAETA